jgi:8-oxo-dGTP pyrophosphatase MutT (NUDIX family)
MTEAAIPAATLVVMRERASETPELLMVERTRRMAFAGGAMVFPGGRIDREDERAGEQAGDDQAAAKIAAIRETLEETAVPVALTPMPSPELAAALQRHLHEGLAFASLLDRHGLRLDLEQLTLFARWMPAFHQARVFDTLFFLARAPDGDWHPIPQEGECESVEWLSAREVLDRIGRGEATAIFPTIRNLERLAQFGSFAEAVDDARAHPVETITPWVASIGGIEHVCIPDGIGYPVTSEPLETVRRGVGSAAFPEA